jgi:FHA domain
MPRTAADAAPEPILISSVPSFDQEAITTPPRPEGNATVSTVEPEVRTQDAPWFVSESESEPDSDRTQLSTRRRAARWRLVLPDGQKIVVTKTTLVGRNPGSNSRFPGAKLESVSDPAKSVSKTHAVLQADSEGLWITDLGSTNGVIVTQPDGTELDLGPEERTRVETGAAIDLGDFIMRVELD